MIRFPFLEQFDVTAVMSDCSDGDCREREGSEAFIRGSKLSLNLPLHLLSQIHSVDVVEACVLHDGVEADAFVSHESDRIMGIRIADCVPVYIFDPITRSGALVHAGREGTFQQITAKAVDAMCEIYGSLAENIYAVIGPSAGPCCYEVSEEMARGFDECGGVTEGRNLDLWQSNLDQLIHQGLLKKHIEVSGICTICSKQFHSYRANAPSARNIAILHIHPK